MITTPKVSVIIPTYNYGHYVAEAIQSVLEQTFQDFELIVVDDGSTDDTEQVVAQFGDALQYIYQHNRGYAAARNVAIQQSRGTILAFLDADDMWLPQKLAVQVDYFERHLEVGVVSASYYHIDAHGKVTGKGPHTPQAQGWLFERLLTQGNFIAMPTVAIRRQCFETVGLFDESLKTTVDWDLWLRLSSTYPFGYIDQYLAQYRLHEANMHRKADIKARDTLAVLDKAFSKSDLPLNVRHKRGQVYGQAHLTIAWRYILNHQTVIARQHLFQAVKLYPRHVANPLFLRMLLATVIGTQPYARLRRLRYE